MSDSPWEFFTVEELSCHCGECGCGPEMMDDQFMDDLVQLRIECNFPFPITSAYRCPEHNAAESSTGNDGPHTTGKAVDIHVTDVEARILISKAHHSIFPGLGSCQKGERKNRFVHLDALNCRTWSY